MIITLVILFGILTMVGWGELYIRTSWMIFPVWLAGLAVTFIATAYWMVRLTT